MHIRILEVEVSLHPWAGGWVYSLYAAREKTRDLAFNAFGIVCLFAFVM